MKLSFRLILSVASFFVVFGPLPPTVGFWRGVASRCYEAEYDGCASNIYRVLAIYGDTISEANAMAFKYRAVQETAGVSKQEIDLVDQSLTFAQTELANVSPLGNYNLAMQMGWGKDGSRSHTFALQQLQLAAKKDDPAAKAIMENSSTDLIYDEIIKRLADYGDPEAAYYHASNMHYSGDAEASIKYLRKSAVGGVRIGMSELGWDLINQENSEYEEAERWLNVAANLGAIDAANRLGDCYHNAFYFCKVPDFAKAAYWYGVAAEEQSPARLTRYKMEAGIIRLGFGRFLDSYSRPINTQESAVLALADMLILGQGVPKNPERALSILKSIEQKSFSIHKHLMAALRNDADARIQFVLEVLKRDLEAGGRWEGLKPFFASGALSVLTTVEIEKWETANIDVTKLLETKKNGDYIFIVNEAITLPAGMSGSFSASFVVPLGVTAPAGPPSHNEILVLQAKDKTKTSL
jgi:TPR repeat protein